MALQRRADGDPRAAAPVQSTSSRRIGTGVSRAQSAPDGYYLFQSVPPGDYLLLLPDQLGMRMVSIGADEPLIRGVDFRLEAQANAS